MKARFLHIADCHLGYKQYNHKERFNDFTRAFQSVVNVAIEKRVDFVILAGDLFQKRAIDALTLNQAMKVLESLQRARIPCIAVEGNHEQAYYVDYIGWMEFLAQRELIKLLDVKFKEGQPQLKNYANLNGSHHDPIPGLRIHGLGYRGAGTPKAVELYAKALAKQPSDNIDYTIFVAHAGVEGVLSGHSGGLSHRQWSVLRPHVDYLALGHIHKPFEFEDWIYNPGSPETCSISEAEWSDRGYYLVDVDTERPREQALEESDQKASEAETYPIKHSTTRGANRRRPFHRYKVKVDLHNTPEMLYDYCRGFLERKAQDISSMSRNGTSAKIQPVVELRLTGILPFDRGALNIEYLKEMVEETFHPLIPLVRNLTQSADFGVDLNEDTLSRVELEHQVLTDLLARDARFQEKSTEWAVTVRQVKNMALSDADPETIITELASHMEKMGR